MMWWKCAYFVGKYLQNIGIKEPRRTIITDSLGGRIREICIQKMSVKPHKIIENYFN